MKKVMFWLILALLLPMLLLGACSSGEGNGEDAFHEIEESDVPEGAPRLTALTLDGGYEFRFLPGKQNLFS